ncbi:MAG TPA: hypothetical protein VK002_15715 [Rubricoccaceae bacterium]|nr:hypothetical protein [Rubricoccaceae bacterium]
MHRTLLLFALAASGCASVPPPPVADLVPADELTALMPDSVGAFLATGDEVYRGYFADSAGALTLVTAARTYMRGAVMMTLNVSSMDRPDRFRALVEAGGARATPDSVVQADPALAAAVAAGWDVYDVAFGRLLLHEDGRAVEAKSMLSDVPATAVATVDLARLAALTEERVTVDTSFVRASPPAPAPPRDGGVIG